MFGEFSSLLVKDKTALALVFYLNFSMVFVCCLAQGFAVGGMVQGTPGALSLSYESLSHRECLF